MNLHDINLCYTYNMIQQTIRSIKETAKFDKYSYDWNTSVIDPKIKFQHWTADDLLNQRHQFEIFDTNNDRPLYFDEFCCMTLSRAQLPLESEDNKDTATGGICEVARMDTLQQMCYGVF
ncbi:unnamed protein product [Coregonus sp. 'balchen']|nr:unnamed protein product [Coregonus sp. 'balchen']